MTPDAHACLLDWVNDGPFDGILFYETPETGQRTVRGRVEGVIPPNPWQPFTHIRVSDRQGEVALVALDTVISAAVTLAAQPAPAHTTRPVPQPVAGPTTVAEVYAEVNRILDAYNASDDGETPECAPEDRWRLYRDLHALTGYTPDPDRR